MDVYEVQPEQRIQLQRQQRQLLGLKKGWLSPTTQFSLRSLEEFKIDLVKQYLQGKRQKDICKEYGVAKSTMWGWICKYASF